MLKTVVLLTIFVEYEIESSKEQFLFKMENMYIHLTNLSELLLCLCITRMDTELLPAGHCSF